MEQRRGTAQTSRALPGPRMPGGAGTARRWAATPPAWVPISVGVACALGGLLANSTGELSTGASLIWLPTAVLVTAMCVTPRRWWPWLGLGALAAQVLNGLVLIDGVALPLSITLGIVNVVESAAVSLAFLRLSSSRPLLHSARSVVSFASAAALVPALTGLVAAAALTLGMGGAFLAHFEQWWFGHGLGMLAGVPIGFDVIARIRREYEPVNARMTSIGVGIAVGLFVSCAALATVNPAVAERLAVTAGVLFALWLGVTGAAISAPSFAVVSVLGVAAGADLTLVASQLLTIPLVTSLLVAGAVVESLHRASNALTTANLQIEAMAVTDELTGLANLRGLRLIAEAEMVKALKTRVPLAVLYADLDGLKQINDTLGHAAGSQALIDFAEVMRSSMPEAAVLARVGGDEFAALFRVDVLSRLEEYPADLRAGLTRYNEEERPYRLQTSIGVALARPGERLDDFLARADARMYDSKRDNASLMRDAAQAPTAQEDPRAGRLHSTATVRADAPAEGAFEL